jgi:hypothetical protein
LTGIDEYQNELAGKNYKYFRPGIETIEWNARMMEVIDPFGNKIRFCEELATES